MLFRTDEIEECSRRLERGTQKLMDAADNVGRVGRELRALGNYEELEYILKNKSIRLRQTGAQIHTLASTLSYAASCYQLCEARVCLFAEEGRREAAFRPRRIKMPPMVERYRTILK